MRKLIVANWKMNKGIVQSQQFAEELREYTEKHKITHCEIVICPPYTSLEAVHRKLDGSSIAVGAQNVFYETSGAFTGEVSAGMLKSCGCEYVITGHSERRSYFHETDAIINKKVMAVLDEGLKPILCIGETLQEHEDKITEAVIEEQINHCLAHIDSDSVRNIVIAYEPVWAIGTGKNATPHQVEHAHNFIRRKIKKIYNEDVANNIRIIYGGSITPDNASDLFSSNTINGGLVGGASLELESFIQIINSAKK
ncbi:MAG: triose-phosphate isomerase [Ignavibacteria bacterium]|nr:triose-phosphate isomerase [Ignavibacteria bacterium]